MSNEQGVANFEFGPELTVRRVSEIECQDFGGFLVDIRIKRRFMDVFGLLGIRGKMFDGGFRFSLVLGIWKLFGFWNFSA